MALAVRRGIALHLAALEGQRGHLFPWAPVCLGTGIGLWFALPFEPPPVAYLWLALAALAALPFAWRGPEAARPVFAGLILVALGALLAGERAHRVAAPVLDGRFYGAVEGRVIALDRSLSDKPRLTLDRVVLEGIPPDETPARVRVSLHGAAEEYLPETGATVLLTGHLSPPQGPAEPGAFDFRRAAWFDRIGAVGYTRSAVMLWEPAEPGLAGLMIARLRRAISEGVRAAIPGEAGAFSAAIITGDRSGIGRETTDHLRNSSLAHLLSVSGLHMALLTSFVFLAMRSGLALIPALALRINLKKTAAVAALFASAFYLALSGGDTPTERSFVMMAVMLVAVLIDRQALSLRSLAAAALAVLMLHPEALVEPGFQMSFAATAALIAAFRTPLSRERRLPPWAMWVAGLFFSSLVAGAATAPYAAAHFNRMAEYSILANMLAVPIMGALVMPAAVVAALLWPFGLSWLPLKAMEWGNGWVLFVAEWVSSLPGAVLFVKAAPGAFLPLFTLGALFGMLWQGRARWAGFAPVALAFALWTGAERPPLLIADTGGLIGIMTSEGRALTKPEGDGFAGRSWLEDDGDGALQEEAFARAGFSGEAGALVARLGEVEIVHVSGRGWRERLAAECRSGRIIVVAQEAEAPGPCRLLDPRALAETGALALWIGPEGLRIETVAEHAGVRLWTRPGP
jgi:competence protein ComEC